MSLLRFATGWRGTGWLMPAAVAVLLGTLVAHGQGPSEGRPDGIPKSAKRPAGQAPPPADQPARPGGAVGGGGAVDPVETIPLPPPKTELEAVQRRNDELRRQIERAEAFQRQMASETPKIENSIASLRAEIENLREWKKATFVLGDPRGTVAAAIRIDGERFLVQGIAEGRRVSPHLAAAAKDRIVCVATQAGRDLARRIASSCRRGDAIQDALLEELKTKVWKTHPLLPLADAGGLRFVVFRDAQKRSHQQIGVFSKVEGETLFYQPIGRDVRQIDRSRIEPGTLRADVGADILDAVDGDATFLDYCVLSAAHELSQIGKLPGHMAIGVRVELDGISGSLQDQSRLLVRRGDSNDFFRCAGIPFFDFAFEYTTYLADPNAALKELARGIEDSLYTKLHTAGFPVVELENIESLRKQPGDVPSSEMGAALNATHLLVAEVGPSRRSGMYRLSVRLIDSYRGNVVWAIDSEPTLPPHDPSNPLFLKSGRLATIRSVKDLPEAQVVPLEGMESPLLVPLARANSRPLSQLVLLEASPPGEVRYRSLFSRRTLTLPERLVSVHASEPSEEPKFPKTVVVRPVEKGVDQVADESMLESQLTRAVIWAIASASMTPAGRIVEELEEGRAFRISLGSQDGIQKETLLRILRPGPGRPATDAAAALSGAPSSEECPLPITFKVRTLDADSCVVVPIRMGLEIDAEWNDGRLTPRLGDIVYNPCERPRKFAVFPPEDRLRDVAGVEFGRMPVSKQQKIMIDQQTLAATIRSKIVTSFVNLHAAFSDEGIYEDDPACPLRDRRFRWKLLNVQKTCEQVAAKGATHAIGGYIKPDRTTFENNVRYEVELVVFELHRDANGQWSMTDTNIQLPRLRLGAKLWD
ncbi:hypothetical protein [Planctomyces sp. SH-PL14]|uniref:hypothetical protein n=1 Tax=Planctomyces sp. SH-PL14 TaxID=1632864 RepID=UPI00078D9A22|nr:hypothetical protein [Planctomyces sp. SH-PL14]AMV21632.1 hypothetical protein VT03_27260 [Planctomyces sp. SH-PL14]